MISQENIDRIESYLLGELSPERETTLMNDADQDPALATELDRRETAHRTLDFMIAENLKSQLMSLEQEDSKVVQMPRRRKLYPLAIAASLAILVGAFFVLFPGQTSGDYSAQYYTMPDLTLRGDQAQQMPELISEAATDINNQNYQAALTKLAQADTLTGYEIVVRYYEGHALYLDGDYVAARQAFADVAAGKDMRFVEDAQWYRLLSCVEVENTCGEELEALMAVPQHPYHNRATEIAKKLK